jgi:hypothetical protein
MHILSVVTWTQRPLDMQAEFQAQLASLVHSSVQNPFDSPLPESVIDRQIDVVQSATSPSH